MELHIECKCTNPILEKRAVIIEYIDKEIYEVEYELFCKNCGMFLGRFCYGHWEY